MINLGNINIIDLRLGASQVKALYLGNEQVWSGEEPVPVADWVCFTAVDAGATISLNRQRSIDASFMTSTDGQTWTDYTFYTVITLENVGDKVYFRAKDENTVAFYKDYNNWLQFKTTADKRIAASGNIMTLLKADGLKTDITNRYQFRGLFQNCTSLMTAPELPATTLADSCYAYMFDGCTSLSYIKVGFTNWTVSGIVSISDTWVSGVAATGTFVCPGALDTSKRNSYRIPAGWTVVLPLTFTAQQTNSSVQLNKNGSPDPISLEYSYDESTWTDYTWSDNTGDVITLSNVNDKVYMRAKTENQTIGSSSSNYYKFVMTGKIAASGNIQTLLKADGSRTDAPAYCYNNMFKDDCTSLTTAPTLPATTLANSCYSGMFNTCTSLTTAPELPATTLAESCYLSMFSFCFNLTAAPVLPATTLASFCYSSMFSYCTSLTTAPELPATTLAERCYLSMFSNCTSLTAAPALPATTLAFSCYSNMFSYCTSLSSVEVAFTEWTSGATPNWLNDVAASGTFTCPSTLSDTRGVSNIPEGWMKVDVA